jgi:hypothetical protein
MNRADATPHGSRFTDGTIRERCARCKGFQRTWKSYSGSCKSSSRSTTYSDSSGPPASDSQQARRFSATLATVSVKSAHADEHAFLRHIGRCFRHEGDPSPLLTLHDEVLAASAKVASRKEAFGAATGVQSFRCPEMRLATDHRRTISKTSVFEIGTVGKQLALCL